MSDQEDIDPIDEDIDGGSDLFGDGDDASIRSEARDEVLDDDDLASDPEGIDADRTRPHYDDDEPQETRQRVVMGVQTYRHRLPKPTDGMVTNIRKRI